MGCWGITAFESDAGLDAVDFIRNNLPKDGALTLRDILAAVQQDDWNAPATISDGESHSSPMALAEIMLKFLDGEVGELDSDREYATNESRFSDLTTFAADKESVEWLRNYLSGSLDYAMADGNAREHYGGWFEEKNWIGWQAHMRMLISRLDILLASPGEQVELIQPQTQTGGPVMGQSL
ncbi:DUF4259 domain-containing protein [Ruminococcaceae bacterium OttesenSCG-928-D13]|nr:DUF4259 domain-containing protein [Ruminococcaceae bacterium OttesenSCG-928-D13]